MSGGDYVSVRTTYDGSLQAIRILYRIMAMVPRASVLFGFKYVLESVVGWYWALSYTIDPIHWHTVKLSDTMPMYASAVVFHRIANQNMYCLWKESVTADYHDARAK